MNNFKLYNNNFRTNCLDLFKSNVPNFFDPSEEILFNHYLQKDNVNYFLLFNCNNQLMAAGGYELEKTLNTIALTWGMVHTRYHKKGYGKSLVEFRLKSIANYYPQFDVVLNTSQKTFRFYEKLGFKLVSIKKDYYGVGLDRYDMIKSKH